MDWPPQELDFNTRGYDKYHHVIQYTVHGQDKSVKLCRCWQSKRFPYCDDTHKVLIEAGDNVGPYVAKISGRSSKVQNVATNALHSRSQLPRTAAFFSLGFSVVGLACLAASAHARGQRLSVEVDLGSSAAPAPVAPAGAGPSAAC
mmetsp:Transcript_131529/g.281170  ORF Transcript_131529/g.281170 Transcript_131529/m.281170 type:complete len:146 (+) Transcript_131529:56-493(+)